MPGVAPAQDLHYPSVMPMPQLEVTDVAGTWGHLGHMGFEDNRHWHTSDREGIAERHQLAVAVQRTAGGLERQQGHSQWVAAA